MLRHNGERLRMAMTSNKTGHIYPCLVVDFKSSNSLEQYVIQIIDVCNVGIDAYTRRCETQFPCGRYLGGVVYLMLTGE